MSDIRPTHEAENILQFEFAESLYGRLWQYRVGHSVLILEFSKSSASGVEVIYAGFEMVRYIDLPIYWQGGNIKTASEVECLAQLSEVNFFDEKREHSLKEFQDYALSFMRLFLIDTPKKQYKILATNNVWLTTDPHI